MALYLVIHSPRNEPDAVTRPPTRLHELAHASQAGESQARWLRTWSPDLHDDRIFTLWDAANADAIRTALKEFGFLDDMDATPMRVREWGPQDVLAAAE